jgi:hypothetical protein
MKGMGRMRKSLTLFVTITYVVLTSVIAYAGEPGEDNNATEFVVPKMVEANLTVLNGDDTGLTVCFLYEDDEKESEYDPNEVFYFGADEDRIRVEMEKKMRFLDPTSRAHHDIRLIIGSSFITTSIVMVVLGILHTKKEIPRDYHKNKQKYDELYDRLGYIPLIEVKEVYYPSVVIGTVLCGTGVYLFF